MKTVKTPTPLFEHHMHTPLCKHAVGMPGEYAAVAEKAGLSGIIVTCHSPMPDRYSEDVRMSPGEFPEYLAIIGEAAETWRGRVEILPGMESDYVPGMEKWLEELHGRAEFHHVLGSIHPQMRDFKSRYHTGDNFAYQELYFEMLADAAGTGLFDTMSHPDLIKNEDPAGWDIPRIMPSILKSLDRIAKTGVAMELNTSGKYKRIREMNPFPQMLVEIGKRGIPVVIGADAHNPARVGEGYGEAMRLLLECGIDEISCYRSRKRTMLPIRPLLESFGD